jgi:6-phosphogluconolactonase/glucosamine-6-phosphate isomerase/deaminase
MADPVEAAKAEIERLLTSQPDRFMEFEPLQKAFDEWSRTTGNEVRLTMVLGTLARAKKVTFSIRGQATDLRHSDQVFWA